MRRVVYCTSFDVHVDIGRERVAVTHDLRLQHCNRVAVESKFNLTADMHRLIWTKCRIHESERTACLTGYCNNQSHRLTISSDRRPAPL